MPVYTVHGLRAEGAAAKPTTDRIVFVRDGFAFWAFVFGPFWLAWHRLWLALLGAVVALAGLSLLLGWLGVSSGTRGAVMFVAALLMGLEAASLRRWTLSRRKWRQLDVVAAGDRDAAERRFFDRWTAERGLGETAGGAPPPVRAASMPSLSSADASSRSGIIGLFPQPGAPR